jgi:ribonuclease P protein component
VTESVISDATRTTETVSKPLRLNRLVSAQYKVVFGQKRSLYGQTMSVWVADSKDADRKVGVIVSKRIFRRAVDRNRAKRLMREAFRLTAPSLVTGVHLVLIARSGIKDKKCAEVMKDFERIAKRARVWNTTV